MTNSISLDFSSLVYSQFRFKLLEVHGVRIEDESGLYVRTDDKYAEFWTIYGCYECDGLDLSVALIDCNNRDIAEDLQGLIECVSCNWVGNRITHP